MGGGIVLNKYNDVLSVDDLCKILGIGRNTAYKILQDNTIPSRRIGRKYIIPKHGVIQYLKNTKYCDKNKA